MIFENKTTDALVSFLGTWPRSMNEIFEYSKDITSRPNMYKHIKRLIDNQILVKKDGKISLNFTWIMSYLKLGETIKDVYLNQTSDIFELWDWEELVYRSDSLFNLDPIWWDLLQQCNLIYDYSLENYFYNTHTYHIIGLQKTETAIHKNVWDSIPYSYFMIWNKSFLDSYWESLLNAINGYGVFFMEWDTFMQSPGYFLNIVGDYIIEVILPKTISTYFDLFFQQTQNIDSFDVVAFQNIFHMKGNFKLSLKKNKKLAKKFKEKILINYHTLIPVAHDDLDQNTKDLLEETKKLPPESFIDL